MSALWSATEIAAATGGVAAGTWQINSVDIDSRTIESGGLFIALPGTAHDGHHFLAAAHARGAAACMISDPSALPNPDVPHIRVKNTADALVALGAAARARTSARVAAITGSVGKTSVKEVVRQSLERFRPHFVHASVKSYNNHVGVPLTLARMPAHVKFAVLEMGMNHAGEIAALAAQGQPHVAAITTVAAAHLENFANESGIAAAKAEIFSGIAPGGVAIIPHDNAHYAQLRAAAQASRAGDIVSFGMHSPDADVRVEKIARHATCSCVTARVRSDILTYKINQPGDHWISNSLAILAIVQAMGGDLGLAGLVLAELSGIAGRGQRVEINALGGGTALLFDESYNANPASMAAALSVIGGFSPRGRGRRIAILGDMKELGDKSAELHAALAPAIIAADIKTVVCVGPMMAGLKDILPRSISVQTVGSAADALVAAQAIVREDDLVLVKASNSIGLSKVAATLASAVPVGQGED